MKKCLLLLFPLILLFFSSEKTSAQCAMAVNGNVYTVTTPLDNVPGSLRSAINDANIDGTGGLITVACSGPIVLQSPLPQIYCDSLMIIIAGVQLDGGNVCTDPAFEFSTAHSCASLSPNSAINFIPRVFSVFSSDDSGPGTLRDIINAANFSPSQDIIHFNLSGPAPRTIQLNSALPQIIYSLEINGASQPLHGYIGSAPRIAIEGVNKTFPGLWFENINDPSGFIGKVYGLTLHNFSTAVHSEDLYQMVIGDNLRRNVIGHNNWGIFSRNDSLLDITNNFIGLDTGGTAADSNDIGITILGNQNASQQLQVNRNVISGNNQGAIIYNGVLSGSFKGNLIGTDKTGSYEIANPHGGISCGGSNVEFGGLNPGDGNLFSGSSYSNLEAGINNRVLGNKFGTNLAGTMAIPNNDGPCVVAYGGTIIGGPSLSDRNIFGSNAIMILGPGVRVENNYFGIDSSGTINFPINGSAVECLSDSNEIKNNVIRNCESGIALSSRHNVVIGNSISECYNGINCNANFNLYTHNSIFNNSNLGIYHFNNANNNLLPPVIAIFNQNGASGSSEPNAVIELYYSESQNGTPQGKTYITTVTADAAGIWSYIGSLIDTLNITATQTINGNSTSVFADFPLSSHIDSDPDMNISIYPNPANSYFILETSREILQTSISDLLGKTLLTINTYSVDKVFNTSWLENGFYIIRIKTTNGEYFTRIQIVH